jgi:hypothetical protein
MTMESRRRETDDAGDGQAAAENALRAAQGVATEERLRPEGDGAASLLPDETLSDYTKRWEAIQTKFVDDPRTAVRDAEDLVNDVVTRLTEVFTSERTSLERVWSRGEKASTEDLRVALQRYRSFFRRLLAV